MSGGAPHWSHDVLAAMRAREVATICTVPDGGLTLLLQSAVGSGLRVVTLTTEEEGIGISTGLWMGAQRALIAMQSSGVGNTINAIGLATAYRAPCLMLVTMRGEWGEFNPWQVPMGRATQATLEAVGVHCFRADHADAVGETFAAAADLAFNGNLPAAVLVGQRVIGTKGFGRK